jgi:glycerophosphoryl diester phosphodiesterase
MTYPLPEKRCLRIGHRGASAHAPDNTLTSFRKAAELGADMVELDVQRTADGQAAVIHDLFLRAATGQVLPVAKTTLAELRAVDLGGGERVPSIHEALDTIRAAGLGAYIELKDGGAIPLVIQALIDLDFCGHALVGSFRPDWVADFTAALPQVGGSVLFGSRAMDGPRAVSLARAAGARFVHPCWESDPHPSALLTPAWLQAVRAANLGVVCWHEERPAEIAELLALGVDGICSDRPELLKAKE